jgi:hypothetical protein
LAPARALLANLRPRLNRFSTPQNCIGPSVPKCAGHGNPSPQRFMQILAQQVHPDSPYAAGAGARQDTPAHGFCILHPAGLSSWAEGSGKTYTVDTPLITVVLVASMNCRHASLCAATVHDHHDHFFGLDYGYGFHGYSKWRTSTQTSSSPMMLLGQTLAVTCGRP